MSSINGKDNTQLAMPYGMRLDELDEEPGADNQKYNDYLKAYTPYVRTERKIGRNDPCPCRSGLKFKKCHGA